MHALTVYVSFDQRYNAEVIQGYKIEFKPNHQGEDIHYQRLRSQPLSYNVEEYTFHFEEDEYITHLGVAFGWSLDRLEFTTNHERHFTAGGAGGKYHRIPLPCPLEGTHPRVVSFGLGLGPHDVHQLRAHYLPVTGDQCRDIAWELEQEREAVREREEQERFVREAEEEEKRRAEEEEAERLR